jgi:hypothetical protein
LLQLQSQRRAAVPAALLTGNVSPCPRIASAEPTKGTDMANDLPINGREPDRSEDDIQRDQLGPRGVPGGKDPAKMTPQREKKTPEHVDPGHTA